MPLHLFKERNFNLTTAAGLIIGIAMFGALAYLPTYLQMVTAVSATKAGLMMIPMMAALLTSSVITGRLVSKTGRYKWFPVAGTTIVIVALVLLSTMSPTMPVWLLCSYLGIMGLGLGMSMQILVLIVQNSFHISQVGTATASNNYFRQIGASLGAAVVGTLFTAKLTQLLAEKLPATGTGTAGGSNSFTPDLVNHLPKNIHDIVVSSYNEALTPVFLYMVPLVAIAVVLLCFVEEKPLATTIKRDMAPESLEVDGAEHVRIDKKDFGRRQSKGSGYHARLAYAASK
jgi:MFS family permease